GELHSLRSLSSGKNKPDLGSNLLKINMYKHACAHARGKTGGGARFGVRDDDKHTCQTKNGSRPIAAPVTKTTPQKLQNASRRI
ncbi:hypothetical protein J9A48_28335, partial [Klebsiella pneumoniae]